MAGLSLWLAAYALRQHEERGVGAKGAMHEARKAIGKIRRKSKMKSYLQLADSQFEVRSTGGIPKWEIKAGKGWVRPLAFVLWLQHTGRREELAELVEYSIEKRLEQ